MGKSLVIIPTYNECENIEKMIHTVMSLPHGFHVLIIDDSSPDGTAHVVEKVQNVYPGRVFLKQRSGKMGLGTAYILGFKYALANAYEYIFEMDADFSHNPNDLVRLLHVCEHEGFHIALGSRYVHGMVNVINWPIERLILSYLASHYVRFITGMPIADPTGGFICYHRSVLEKIILDDIRFVGYGFQIEMKFNAWKYGFTLKEVPIVFTDRYAGESKMSKSIIWEAIFGIIKLKIYSLFVRYT